VGKALVPYLEFNASTYQTGFLMMSLGTEEIADKEGLIGVWGTASGEPGGDKGGGDVEVASDHGFAAVLGSAPDG
jgi:hypothetical protein